MGHPAASRGESEAGRILDFGLTRGWHRAKGQGGKGAVGNCLSLPMTCVRRTTSFVLEGLVSLHCWQGLRRAVSL